jgi:mRNA interferase RelE/StbE
VTAYLVTFASSAKKELRNLPTEVIGHVLPKIRELATNPRPVGSKKLHGYRNRWRIRFGRYRVVYTIDDERSVVDIARIAHRKDVYNR